MSRSTWRTAERFLRARHGPWNSLGWLQQWHCHCRWHHNSVTIAYFYDVTPLPMTTLTEGPRLILDPDRDSRVSDWNQDFRIDDIIHSKSHAIRHGGESNQVRILHRIWLHNYTSLLHLQFRWLASTPVQALPERTRWFHHYFSDQNTTNFSCHTECIEFELMVKFVNGKKLMVEIVSENAVQPIMTSCLCDKCQVWNR